jgi:hypothetical protein
LAERVDDLPGRFGRQQGRVRHDIHVLDPISLGEPDIAVIRVLEHHHGGQREVILVVRVEEFGRLGQRQEQLGLLVADAGVKRRAGRFQEVPVR